MFLRQGFAVLICILSLTALPSAFAAGPGASPEAKNMVLVGYDDLQGRSAYQPTIHAQNGRWIAYVGHHGGTDTDPQPLNPLTGKREYNGTSIVDVTDPRHPKYLAHIPGESGNYEAGGAQMVRVCDGKTLPKADPAKNLHATHVRECRARDLRRQRSGEPEDDRAHRRWH